MDDRTLRKAKPTQRRSGERLERDQVIREDLAVRSSYVRGRGTETSAEVLVGPPWRMESNAGQQQWYLVNAHSRRRPRGVTPSGDHAVPVPIRLLRSHKVSK
jgi:hypothetical protein